MSTLAIIDDFAFGEELVIELTAKDRDGTTYPSPASATCTLIISTTYSGPALIDVDATLTDAGTALWTFTLDHTDDIDGVLSAGRAYPYWIWTTDAGGDSQLQANGTITLTKALLPA